jgi:hypothetical protein
LVTCFSYSSAQEISTTGELITNTQSAWQGCSTATSGAFWGGYSGGPCPGIDSNGQIIFSYGETTVSQTTSLAAALANSGSGLQINSYNYSWWVKNSNINGTQPGGYDATARVGVTLYNRDGSIAESDLYDYGYYIADWTRFSGVRNYTSPYSLSQVDNISLSVTGRDHGYWAGYYGPEFSNFSLTVNYSVDPCTVNTLSSPSCPGYLEYIASLSSTPTVDTAATTSDNITATPAAPQTSAANEQSSASVNAESQSSSGTGAPLSTILNILGREQARIATVERSTVESAVEQSAREADKSTEQAEAMAAATVMDSITASVASAQNQMVLDQQQADQSSGGGLNVFSASSLSISLPDSGMGFKTPETAMESIETTAGTENLPEIETSGSVLYAPSVTREETLVGNVEERSDSAVSFSGFSAVNVVREELTDSSDDTQNVESTETVKQNVANNDLAGDISLASLGAVPQGFDAYSSMIPDGSFYAPREIYRGQRNVDNARALRGLGTDRLHQDMVDQQYNRGAR